MGNVQSLGENEEEIFDADLPIELMKSEGNTLKLSVKSDPSPLLVSYFELRTRVLPKVAEANLILKKQRTATFDGPVNTSDIVAGDNAMSMFDPQKGSVE